MADELRRVVRNRTPWQFVIHGATDGYRQLVLEELLGRRQWRRAHRFAVCGLGDSASVEMRGEGVKLSYRFCGHRACPRCSKLAGRRALRGVLQRLGTVRHEALFHVVLTQRVEVGESLMAARARFDHKWRRLAKSRGALRAVGGLASMHMKYNQGWHYHMHLIAEVGGVDAGERVGKFVEAWRDAVRDECGVAEPMFVRRVADAGEPFDFEGDEGQQEVWREASGAVARLFQYALREVVQGVERWVERVEGVRQVREFLEGMEGAQLHRAYGAWRLPVEKEESGEVVEDQVAKGKTGGGEWVSLGTMDQVITDARRGVTECVRVLEYFFAKQNGRSLLLKRLTRVWGGWP